MFESIQSVEGSQARFMLRGVPQTDIAKFIKNIAIPSGRGINQNFDCDSLSQYTEQSKLFLEWDIVIATGESKRLIPFEGEELNATERTFRLGDSSENYIRMGGQNNRIVDPGIFNSGVNITKSRQQEILSNKKIRPGKAVPKQLAATDWLKLRERPLLAIYYIDLKTDSKDPSERDKYVAIKEAFGSDLLVGFAVGFPVKEAKVKLSYRANLIMLDNLDLHDEFEEEELEDE
ncbi:MAG: hypothetical protein FWE21_06110 [Defluviitaleaceae bacterium]|nr:hypothetical protein [Defluviitaleaceae bacterium]